MSPFSLFMHDSFVSTFSLLFCFLSQCLRFLQVVQVELAGNAASNYEKQTDCKMPSWMIILLAIAGAVGLFLMLIACCCVSYFFDGYTFRV